jgi:hypothetical protein
MSASVPDEGDAFAFVETSFSSERRFSMQKRFVRAPAFAVALAALAAIAAWPGSAAAQSPGDVIRACDNENQRTPGACEKTERSLGVLHGCAGGVCFVCPTDGRRQCFGATEGSVGGVLHANQDVTLDRDGVNVEAVVHACEFLAEHGGGCDFTTDSLPVVEGRTANGGFQCIDGRECHRLN